MPSAKTRSTRLPWAISRNILRAVTRCSSWEQNSRDTSTRRDRPADDPDASRSGRGDEAADGWIQFVIDLATFERTVGEIFDGPGPEDGVLFECRAARCRRQRAVSHGPAGCGGMSAAVGLAFSGRRLLQGRAAKRGSGAARSGRDVFGRHAHELHGLPSHAFQARLRAAQRLCWPASVWPTPSSERPIRAPAPKRN